MNTSEKENKSRIKKLREILVTKNVMFRAVKSQVDNPDVLKHKINVYREEIKALEVKVSSLNGILISGELMLDDLEDDIASITQELWTLVYCKDLEKLERVFNECLGAGLINADGTLVDDDTSLDLGGSLTDRNSRR